MKKKRLFRVSCVLIVAMLTASSVGAQSGEPNSRRTRVGCVAMHSEMGDVTANLGRVAQWLGCGA